MGYIAKKKHIAVSINRWCTTLLATVFHLRNRKRRELVAWTGDVFVKGICCIIKSNTLIYTSHLFLYNRQAFVEGTLWCITCDADQIIVDDAWAENAEIVDNSSDASQQLEMLDYNQFFDSSLDVGDIDQKKWVELLESGMFSNTEGGSEEDINKIGHFVCDSNMYSLGSVYPVETSI